MELSHVAKGMRDFLVDHGWAVQVERELGSHPEVTLRGTMGSAIRTYRDLPTMRMRCNAEGRMWDYVTGEQNTDFAGGGPGVLADMCQGRVDMRPFEEAKQRLLRTGVLQRAVPEDLFEVRRRRRRLSEHDGDWDWSRRWETAPFNSSLRRTHRIPMIEVLCFLGVNCGNTAEEYNRFGTLVWSVCEVVEKAGIQVRIVGRYVNVGLGARTDMQNHIDVLIKEAGEYVAPSAVAMAFTAVFFRRFVFQMFVSATTLVDDIPSHGLGSSRGDGDPIEYWNGRIVMRPSVNQNCERQIEEVLFKATSERLGQ